MEKGAGNQHMHPKVETSIEGSKQLSLVTLWIDGNLNESHHSFPQKNVYISTAQTRVDLETIQKIETPINITPAFKCGIHLFD